MNRKTFISILAGFAALSVLAGCDPNTPGPDPGPQDQVILFGRGIERIATGFIDGSFLWIEGERVDLELNVPEGMAGTATAMAFDKGNVCLAGYYYRSGDLLPHYTPCFWTNDQRIDLPIPEGYSAFTHSIAIYDGKVWVTGRHQDSTPGIYIDTPCYWVDGVRTDLAIPDPEVNRWSETSSLAVIDGKVCVAGHYGTNPSVIFPRRSQSVPCYWVDGVRTDLEIPDVATEGLTASIAVSGGRVHVAGSYGISALNDLRRNGIGCVWVDGVRSDLAVPAGVNNVNITAAVMSGDVFHVAGSYQDKEWRAIPCYWTDGVRTDLDAPESGYATAITLFDGKLFVAGWHSSNTPCYWVDGERTDLAPMPSQFDIVDINSIAVYRQDTE